MRNLSISKSITQRESRSIEKYLQEIDSIDMVTPDEEELLAIKIQQGDEEALKKLVEANLRFVVSVAKQYQHQGLGLSDLINEGNLGIIRAAQEFDHTKGFKFISYAVWWIRQSILQAIAETGRLVRLPQNQVGIFNKISKTFRELEQEYERDPTIEEIAERMDTPLEKLLVIHTNDTRHISINAPKHEDDERTMEDDLNADEGYNIDKQHLDEGISHEVRLLIKQIRNKDHARLIWAHFEFGDDSAPSFNQVVKELGISERKAKRIVERIINGRKKNTQVHELFPGRLNAGKEKDDSYEVDIEDDESLDIENTTDLLVSPTMKSTPYLFADELQNTLLSADGLQERINKLNINSVTREHALHLFVKYDEKINESMNNFHDKSEHVHRFSNLIKKALLDEMGTSDKEKLLSMPATPLFTPIETALYRPDAKLSYSKVYKKDKEYLIPKTSEDVIHETHIGNIMNMLQPNLDITLLQENNRSLNWKILYAFSAITHYAQQFSKGNIHLACVIPHLSLLTGSHREANMPLKKGLGSFIHLNGRTSNGKVIPLLKYLVIDEYQNGDRHEGIVVRFCLSDEMLDIIENSINLISIPKVISFKDKYALRLYEMLLLHPSGQLTYNKKELRNILDCSYRLDSFRLNKFIQQINNLTELNVTYSCSNQETITFFID